MVKRIIFLIESGFSLRDYNRYGIEILQKNGFKVEVWDLTVVLCPGFYDGYAPSDLFSYDALIVFKDKSEACEKLNNLSKNDFVINLISYNYGSLGVYRALTKSSASYAVNYAGMLPEPSINKGLLNFIKGQCRQILGFRRLAAWKQLFMKLPAKLLGVRPSDLIFIGGENSFIRRYPVNKKTDILDAHALDYDLYLQERENHYAKKPIAVFLEDYFFSDPHYNKLDIKFPFDAGSYYRVLNNFFDLVEKKTGLEVVIAGHPRHNCENPFDYFKQRKYIKGRTINLVQECQLAMTHCSTSVSFANLFYKPIIFMAYSYLDKTYEYHWAREIAKWFGKVPVFIDKDNNLDFKNELTVNKSCYDNYRKAYIKTEHSEDLPFWQIVSNRLKEGF